MRVFTTIRRFAIDQLWTARRATGWRLDLRETTKTGALLVLAACLVVVSSSLLVRAQQEEGSKPQDGLSLSRLLIEVSKNVEDFAENLPDLICTERLEQELLDPRGTRLSTIAYDSRLTGRQTKQQTPRGMEYDFQETREVEKIDGKKPKETNARVTGVQVGGFFSSILISHFGLRDHRDFIWTLQQTPGAKNRYYVLEFHSDPIRPHQYYEFGGKQILSRQKGEAWIDAGTLQVAKIAFTELNLPEDVAEMRYEVTYSPVKLGDEEFWLPSMARTEMRSRKGATLSTAEHRLSDYHKFSGEIKVVN